MADLKSQKMTQCFILEHYCVVREATGDKIRKWMNGFCTGGSTVQNSWCLKGQ